MACFIENRAIRGCLSFTAEVSLTIKFEGSYDARARLLGVY